MHSDTLLTNSVELEGKVKETPKKTDQKKKFENKEMVKIIEAIQHQTDRSS